MNKDPQITSDVRIKHLKDAADLGYLKAMLAFAERAHGDIPTAKKYYNMAIEKADLAMALRSRYLLARVQYKGDGEDLAEARKNFQEVASHEEADDAFDAMWHCAKMAREGIGGPKDLQEACEYYLKMASPRDSGMYHYATIQEELGQLETAREAYRKFLDANDNYFLNYHAAFKYAEMAYNGQGGKVDLSTAHHYYRKAHLDMDHPIAPQAAYRYAQMLQKGDSSSSLCRILDFQVKDFSQI